MKKFIPALIITGILLLAKSSFSQTININFEQKATLNAPVDIVNAGDNSGRMFVVEQRGYVRMYKTVGGLDPDTFLNIRSIVLYGGERGLLSLAFHPNYATNRYFFVYYNNLAGDVTIARYRTSATNPDSAEFSSGQVLLNIPKPFDNHNGGKLNFGSDGFLYFATGDGGSGGDPNNNSQNHNSLLGKMIRIDVNGFATSAPFYDIPPGNPFVDSAGYRPEIFGLGLRNPFRWSFDRQNQDMWIADVGQGAWEEIDYRRSDSTAGVNYGWRCYEGKHAYNTAGCAGLEAYTQPIFEYPHNSSTGGFSVTGGYVYRGTEFPFFQGYYICSDYISGNGWLIKRNGNNFDTTLKPAMAAHITGYGESEDGTLYAVSLDGPVYKVNAVQVIPLHLISFSGSIGINNVSKLVWQTDNEINTKNFEIQYSLDGQRFSTVATTTAMNSPGTNNYSFNHVFNSGQDHFYRLRMNDLDGNYSYSPVIKLSVKQEKKNWVYPTIIQNNVIRLYPSADMNLVELFNAKGQLILKRTLNGDLYKEIPVTGIAKGLYVLKLQSGQETVTQKIIIQ